MEVDYALKNKNSIISSYIVGIASGFVTFFLTYNYNLDSFEYGPIAEIIIKIILLILILLISLPILLSTYSYVKSVFHNKYELITLQYEKDILTHILKEHYNFEYTYDPRFIKKP